MASLLDSLKTFCRENPAPTFWLGLSGGLDSTVLLHAMKKVRDELPIQLKTIHVHHGLSLHADKWALQAEKFSRELEVPFFLRKVNAKASTGESPENIARLRRYEIFAELLAEEDILLTAHHEEDQAETVLLQLCRGSGLKGLSAMPHIKKLGKGQHARPLLSFSRAELEMYAKENHLSWVEDDSNQHCNLSRNFIRHELMPVLASRWPNIAKQFSRSASHIAEAETLLNHFIERDFRFCQNGADTLSVQQLLQLDIVRRKQVLRYWLTQRHFPMPSMIKLQEILQQMLYANEDRNPHVHFGDVEVRRYRDVLYAMKKITTHPKETFFSWDFKSPLFLGEKTLHATAVIGEGLRADIEKVTVRFRQGGEMLQLKDRTHRHELKKLFQAWGIAPWLRNRIPLIFVEEELAAIVGFVIAAPFEAPQTSLGWKFLLT